MNFTNNAAWSTSRSTSGWASAISRATATGCSMYGAPVRGVVSASASVRWSGIEMKHDTLLQRAHRCLCGLGSGAARLQTLRREAAVRRASGAQRTRPSGGTTNAAAKALEKDERLATQWWSRFEDVGRIFLDYAETFFSNLRSMLVFDRSDALIHG